MPAIDFPNSPAADDTFTVGSIIWKWNGTTWQSQGISVAGPANTGQGGSTNAAGGSGIVIVRYPNTRTISIGAGLTGTTASVGSDTVATITAGTGNVSFL